MLFSPHPGAPRGPLGRASPASASSVSPVSPTPPAVFSWPLGAVLKEEKGSWPQSAESGSWVPAVYISLC